MNALGINEVDNEVLNDADAYLRQHKILELFEVSLSLVFAARGSRGTGEPALAVGCSCRHESERVVFVFIGLDDPAGLQAARQHGAVLVPAN